MHAALAQRVDQLVECGWEPHTTTETTASLVGRRPFNWWLFLLVVVFFPLFGGILYLIFWLATSRATVFLHAEGDEVVAVGTSSPLVPRVREPDPKHDGERPGSPISVPRSASRVRRPAAAGPGRPSVSPPDAPRPSS